MIPNIAVIVIYPIGKSIVEQITDWMIRLIGCLSCTVYTVIIILILGFGFITSCLDAKIPAAFAS